MTECNIIKIYDMPEDKLYESILKYGTNVRINGTEYDCALSEIQFWTIAHVYIGEFECTLTKQLYTINPKVCVKYIDPGMSEYCEDIKTLSELYNRLFPPGKKSARATG